MSCTGDFMTCKYDNDHTPECGWHPSRVETITVSAEMFDYLLCSAACRSPEDHQSTCQRVD